MKSEWLANRQRICKPSRIMGVCNMVENLHYLPGAKLILPPKPLLFENGL